jgi:hypothetical protein
VDFSTGELIFGMIHTLLAAFLSLWLSTSAWAGYDALVSTIGPTMPVKTACSDIRTAICYHASMTCRRNLAIIAATVLLAACASPTVDSSAPTFDEAKYAVDLDNCRGGTALDAALQGLGGIAIGSAFGLGTPRAQWGFDRATACWC